MSTSIELFAEKRVGDAWQPVPEPRKQRSKRVVPTPAIDIGNPYALFSLLSGNKIGMCAGLVELPSLFGGRGFPKDMNSVYQKVLPKRSQQYSDECGVSWLELRELIELDWEQPVRRNSFVEAQYADYFHPEKFFPTKIPKETKLYHGLCSPLPDSMVRVEWLVPLREYIGCGAWFIEQLLPLSMGAELRIIYWFS